MTTEQKHEIEIPGLPEGWRAVEAMIDPDDAGYLGDDGNLYIQAKIKLEKIKPRRIVLEETEERANWGTEQLKFAKGTTVTVNSHKIWREVKEE